MTDDVKGLDLEDIPPGEEDMIAQVALMTKQLQHIRAKSEMLGQNGDILRGVHPKSHGCLVGRFTVNPKLRKRMRVGLFREPGKTFKCLLRYSNAAVSIAPDLDGGNGSRGLAVKVLDAGRRALIEDRNGVSQDFLMINTREFAFANVADYMRSTMALIGDQDNGGVNVLAYFLPAKLLQLGMMDRDGNLLPPVGEEKPELAKLRATFQSLSTTPLPIFKDFGHDEMTGTLKTAAVVEKIRKTSVRNPLEIAYFTAAPVRFGRRRIARFSVEPLNGPLDQDEISEAENLDDNYLAKALEATVSKGAALTFRVRAQVIHPVELEGRTELIEDATVAWDPEEFEPVDLAKITVDPADQPKELVDACKAERFTPWHSLPAHEPIGGINRLRKPVYQTSGDERS